MLTRATSPYWLQKSVLVDCCQLTVTDAGEPWLTRLVALTEYVAEPALNDVVLQVALPLEQPETDH
jgi:hypothetical protein